MAGGGREGNALRWVLTYGDLVTLLLAFFIVIYAISTTDPHKYQQVVISIKRGFGIKLEGGTSLIAGSGMGGEKLLPFPDTNTALQETLSESLEQEILEGTVEVVQTEKGILLRLREEMFFELGRAGLTEQSKRILDKVAPALTQIPNAIEVEGHTDSLPIHSPHFPSNWELSAARATAVIRYLVEDYGVSPLRLAARGFGEFKPLVPNDPVRGTPKNRRVEIYILGQP